MSDYNYIVHWGRCSSMEMTELLGNFKSGNKLNPYLPLNFNPVNEYSKFVDVVLSLIKISRNRDQRFMSIIDDSYISQLSNGINLIINDNYDDFRFEPVLNYLIRDIVIVYDADADEFQMYIEESIIDQSDILFHNYEPIVSKDSIEAYTITDLELLFRDKEYIIDSISRVANDTLQNDYIRIRVHQELII